MRSGQPFPQSLQESVVSQEATLRSRGWQLYRHREKTEPKLLRLKLGAQAFHNTHPAASRRSARRREMRAGQGLQDHWEEGRGGLEIDSSFAAHRRQYGSRVDFLQVVGQGGLMLQSHSPLKICYQKASLVGGYSAAWPQRARSHAKSLWHSQILQQPVPSSSIRSWCAWIEWSVSRQVSQIGLR